MELRQFQDIAINQKIKAAIRAGHRKILIVAPTGSGKTVIGAHMMNQCDLKHNHSLFFAHRRELVLQTADKLKKFDCPHAFVMSGMNKSGMTRTQVVSIHSFNAWSKNEKWTPPRAHLVILDEAHLSLSMMWQKMLKLYSDVIILGLTATPCRGDGRGLGDAWDILIEVTSVEELIELGFLIPTRIFAPSVPDLTGVHIRRGDYVEDELEAVMNTNEMVGNVVKEWEKQALGERTLGFTTTIAHAKFAAELFNYHGHKAEYIDGTMDLERRGRIINGHQNGEFDLLFNVNIAVEGYDDPQLSCALDLAPTKSYGRQLQKYGRLMRPSNGQHCQENEFARYIDFSGNVYRHGYPEESGDWSLDPDTSVQERRKEKKKDDPQPTTCRVCYTIYTGLSACPTCGSVPTKQAEKINLKEGRLREVPKKKKTPQEEKSSFWVGCLYKCSHTNRSVGAAGHMYKKKYGCWPASVDRLPHGKVEWNMKAAVFLETGNGQRRAV